MTIKVNVTFDHVIGEAKQRDGTFVCYACCGKVQFDHCDNGCCVETWCPDHPQIMIRNGKVVGTSA